MHVIELRSVFPVNQIAVDANGRRLINFAQCVEFSARMRDLMAYKSVSHTDHEMGPLAYLENQLRSITANTDGYLESRSHSLGVIERRISDSGVRRFQSLGFV